MSLAFWISPTGERISVQTSHVAKILHNPTIFGCSREQLLDIYRKYNERIGLEGKARLEILTELVIPTGWIRVRLYRQKRAERWSISLFRLDKPNMENLKEFFTGINIGLSLPIQMTVLENYENRFFNSIEEFLNMSIDL